MKSHDETHDNVVRRGCNQDAVDHGWWKHMAHESAILLTKYNATTASDMFDECILTGFLAGWSSEPSPKMSSALELICDTAACFLRIGDIHWEDDNLQSMIFFGFSKRVYKPVRRFDWQPADFVYLTQCFLGNIDAVEYSLDQPTQTERNADDLERVKFFGLYVAVRRGHKSLVDYLALHVRLSSLICRYLLWAAVESGSMTMLRHLLGPRYAEHRPELCISSAVYHAAEFPVPETRLKMCRLLLKHIDQIDNRKRKRLLIAACRSDDLNFAKWLFDIGPIDLDHNPRYDPYSHPLYMAAHHGSANVVRYLIRNKLNEYKDCEIAIRGHAFRYAWGLERFDVLFECICHQTLISGAKLLEYTDLPKHALEVVRKLESCGNTSTRNESPEDHARAQRFCSFLLTGTTQNHLILNLEWLLKHGFRTDQSIIYRLDGGRYAPGHGPKLKRRSTNIVPDLENMGQLLEAHGNPGIEIICSKGCTMPVSLNELKRSHELHRYKCNYTGAQLHTA